VQAARPGPAVPTRAASPPPRPTPTATEASYRSVLLALQADVAQTYCTLRTLDAEIAQLDSTVKLIDGGRNSAAIQRAEVQLEEAVAGYRESVLVAFADVENQLSDLRTVRDQVGHVDAAVASARRAAELADTRYRTGEDSYLQLLDAQRELLAIERQAVQLRGSWAVATVDLIRSLGGGWQ
jgi:multidrug efflux system outer membrane protein